MTGSLEAFYEGRAYDLEWAGKTDDLPFWLEATRRYRPARVLELAVGTGRIAVPLARAGVEQGFSVTGLDLVPAMLEQARRRLAAEPLPVQRNLTLVQGDMRAFDLGARFDLALIGFNSIIHLQTADDQIGMFSAARRHLEQGGRFLVDVFNPTMAVLAEAQRPSPLLRVDIDRRDEAAGVRLVRSAANQYFDSEQRTQTRYFYEQFRDDGGYRKTVVDAAFHTVFPRELELLFRMTGFVVEDAFGTYGWTPFVPGCPRMILAGKAV